MKSGTILTMYKKALAKQYQAFKFNVIPVYIRYLIFKAKAYSFCFFFTDFICKVTYERKI